LPKIENFLFFDLETSGLSGGAGTVAFLAAFGRFVKKTDSISLRITQYLLLDYPGENDFLEALLGEFNNKEQIIVSYNGKCFDSQILKTRCLMNRIQPPDYFHADLLHPARRLWKTVLDDCSQGTIETNIIGLDRTGDIPGALAPEIWFDFLKTSNAERLMGICDHNCRDIAGLAEILCAMSVIAEDPIISVKKYRYDIEQLALRWRAFLRQSGGDYGNLNITGTELLRIAVKQKYPRASLIYAMDQLRGGKYHEGRKLLLRMSAGDFPENIRAAALRALAIDSERRLKDITEALEFARQGLEIPLTGYGWKDFEHRCKRLEQKLRF
jgi:autonomous glycyl radical cofactor GrcA